MRTCKAMQTQWLDYDVPAHRGWRDADNLKTPPKWNYQNIINDCGFLNKNKDKIK